MTDRLGRSCLSFYQNAFWLNADISMMKTATSLAIVAVRAGNASGMRSWIVATQLHEHSRERGLAGERRFR